MAIKVRRTFKGESSTTGNERSETWMFDVHADNLTYTVTQAKTAVDAADATKKIPVKGDVHPEDEGMMCAEIQASRDESRPTLIRVTVTWRSPQGQGESQGGDEEEETTPIWNIELGFDREAYTELQNRDLDEVVLENVVGDPLEPVERKGTDPVYIYTYFVKNLDWVKMGEAHGCVNDAAVVLNYNGRTKSFPKHTLMIEPRFSVTDTLSDGGLVYRVECRLTYKRTTWFTKLINQGFNAYPPDAGDEASFFPARILDANNQPKNEPSFLDAEGRPLAVGEEVVMVPLEGDGYRFIDLLDFTTLPGFGG